MENIENIMTSSAVVSPSLRTGLSPIPSTSPSPWGNGRGIDFATANRDAIDDMATKRDAVTVRATNVAALATQGAPPRGEPR